MNLHKKKLSECKTTSWLKDNVSKNDEEFELIKIKSYGQNVSQIAELIIKGNPTNKEHLFDLLMVMGTKIKTSAEKLKGKNKNEKES